MTGDQIEKAARAAHEANRAYCIAIGDDSQPPWSEAPDWQKQSAVTGVHFIFDNPDAPPSASHDSWLKEKERDGWRYGPVKSPHTKEHPCFVPYADLPEAQKAKDAISVSKIESRSSDVVLHARGRFGNVVEVEIGVAEAAELMRALLRALGAGALKSFLGIK